MSDGHPRDSGGRLLCFHCRQPLKVRSTRDRDYGWCHGQTVVCSEADLALLREYGARLSAPPPPSA